MDTPDDRIPIPELDHGHSIVAETLVEIPQYPLDSRWGPS